jgi:nucleotide-binding universal stress UspA family protein
MSVVVSNHEYETLAQPLLEKEQSESLAHLDSVRAQVEAAGIACHTTLRHGTDVYQEVVDEAESSGSDLIVMGRRGKRDLLRVMLGGTTAHVIGHTHCDVLVIPREARIEGNRILLPVDGSRYSDAAATTVASLARQCRASIHVLSAAANDEQAAECEGVVRRVGDLLRQEGLEVTTEVARDRPDEAIVAAAERLNSDLIVMGSHGRTGLERILVGSVSERVIGRAGCAVMVAKL